MIESTENKKIKHIKKLNAQVKFRKKENQFVLENKQAILDVIKHHVDTIDYIVLIDTHLEIEEAAKTNNISIYQCSKVCMYYMSSMKEPMGCFAVINQPEVMEKEADIKLAIALYNIKSPANCGAIIRNAHAFGCDAIYLIGNCCDPFHPESVRACAGHILSIPMIEKESINSLSEYVCWKLDIKASISLNEVPKEEKICFILGSEQGFKPDSLSGIKSCYIPMRYNTDSLNVAATSAIVLYSYVF